jgi:uncharacterized protein
MRTLRSMVVTALCVLSTGTLASAQGIQISRDNRTIAVSATGTVEADPEIALISIGYESYGKTRDAAYSDNTQTASKIIGALVAAGVKQESIETSDVRVALVESTDQENMTPQERKDRQFQAEQSWQLRVPPAQAQNAVDRAVAAGAEVKGVWWEVADLDALDAKAQAAALSKAHGIAEKMAQQFGGKVGQLLFVSNAQPGTMPWLGSSGGFSQSVTVEGNVVPSLKLFPQKIRRDATVYAAFSLE